MQRHIRPAALAGAMLLAAAIAAPPAVAESAADFYNGKTVTLVEAAPPGGGYDLYSRTLIEFMGKYLDGHPKFLVQYMPGAGGRKAADYLYAVAPRDGTMIGLISNAAPVFQVLQGGVKYNASKFNYIGRVASMQYVIMVWHTTGVKSLADMKKKLVTFGATGKSQSNYMVPILLKTILGLKAKVISGYPGTADINHALEQGEIGGRAGAWSSWIASKSAWIKAGDVVPIAQSGLEKATDLPHAPLLLDLAKTDEERKVMTLLASDAAVGRGFMMPPAVPKDRVQAMRRAFDKVMKDPAFLTEAKKRRLIVEPMTGEKLQGIVDNVVGASPQIIKRAKQVLEWN